MRDSNAETPGTNILPQPSAFGGPLDTLLRQGLIGEPMGPGILGFLDHYEICRLLGAGGMGMVLLARDTRTGLEVALKVPRPELLAHPPARQRFLGEARHMQKLVHRHILPVLELQEDPQRPFFVMPYCRRGSLAQLIKPGIPLEPGLVLMLAHQIAEALAFAHRKGVIHCDLKPGNVLLDEAGDACLTDFGLARSVVNDVWALDADGEGVGTAPYMSPALAAGEVEDTRCDIYSFGALLYEMLTGQPPYVGRNAQEIREQIRAGPPRPLREVQPLAPAGLAVIAETAMSRELRDRYAHMSDVLADLDRIAKVEQFQRKHRTEQVTFLFTNLVNATELNHPRGDRPAAEVLPQLEALVRQVLQQFPEGEALQTTGDSWLLLFAKPAEAVGFSLLLQARLRQLHREDWTPLQSRVGIHMGAVALGEPGSEPPQNGFSGWAVDACARVMSLAKGGQILITREGFDRARQVLKGKDIEGLNQLAWWSHGPYLLQGFEEPVEICEVGEVGLCPLSAPKTSEKAQRQVSADSEPVLGWRPAIGQVVPNTPWVLEHKLGEGGVGEVWLGRHSTLQEQRVFKFCFQANRVRSLKREVTLFRLLKERIGNHPNIVGVQDVFFDEAPYYLMMDYADGKDLKAWCEEQGGAKNVSVEVRLEIVAQVADALQAAHDAGVIHRDVKPANILVAANWRSPHSPASEPTTPLRSAEAHPQETMAANTSSPLRLEVKLTDFGIGQVLSQEYLAGMTRAGFTETVLSDSSSSKTGTQLYMAPELLAGKPASIRSDIYSLGVVLFQLLVGDFTRPLTTDWEKMIGEPLLREDLKRCFAGNPQERFAGAAQLAANLRMLGNRQTELAERQNAERQAQQRKKIWVALATSAAVLLLVALGLGYGLRQARRQRDRAQAFLYASDMNHAFAALQENYLGRVDDLLNRHRPQRGERDLRDWEWRYLWQKSRSDELFTLGEHNADVTTVAFSPDGALLASGDWNSNIKVWDLNHQRLVTNYYNHTNSYTLAVVSALSWSTDGRRLLSGAVTHSGQEEVFKVMDTGTWSKVTQFYPQLSSSWFRAMAFSPGAKVLAMANPTEAFLWDLVQQRMIGHFEGDFGYRSDLWNACAAFSPDGSLYAYHEKGIIRLWDMVNKKPAGSFLGIASSCCCLVFSPDGRQLAASNGDKDVVQVWDLDSHLQVASLTNHVEGVNFVLFSPNGKTLAASSSDGLIILWDRASWTEFMRLRGHQNGIYQLAYSPDARFLASGSLDNTVKLWDAQAVHRDAPFIKFSDDLFPGPYRRAYLCRQGQYFLLARSNMTFSVWEKKSLTKICESNLPITNYLSGAVSPDGRLVAFGDSHGKVRVYELANMKETAMLDSGSELVWVLEFSPDGKKLAAGGSAGSRYLRVWELATKQELAVIPYGSNALIFSSDGCLLAKIMYLPGAAQIWDLKSGQQLTSLRHSDFGLNDVALSPCMRYAATAGSEGVKLWDLPSGKALATWQRRWIHTASVGFSPDSRRVAAGSGDLVTLWDVATHQELGSLKSAHGKISWLEFLPDGSTLLVATDQGVFSWYAPSFEEIAASKNAEPGSPIAIKSK
jgi:serine/threonine protein kinase